MSQTQNWRWNTYEIIWCVVLWAVKVGSSGEAYKGTHLCDLFESEFFERGCCHQSLRIDSMSYSTKYRGSLRQSGFIRDMAIQLGFT